MRSRDFPGGPVVKTLHFHCRGHRFDTWLGNYDLSYWAVWPKVNKQTNKQIFKK